MSGTQYSYNSLGAIPHHVIGQLRKLGHKIVLENGWSNGRVTAVHYDSRTHVLRGAASPRFETPYALGW